MMKVKVCVLVCIVLAVLGGCRKSSPPVEQAKPSAAATPTPGNSPIQLKYPAAPKEETPEELLSKQATKTFQVTAPADISADQIPADAISEFIVPGHAGEVLRVEVKESEGQGGEPEPKMAARMAGESVALKELADPYICPDEHSYSLLQDGAVHVIYDPKGRKFPLRFTLLKKDDPMLSVGLMAEQVSINYGKLGTKKEVNVKPYSHICDIGSSWPAYVLVQSDAGWLYVAQVQGFKNLFPDDPSMQNLISSIAQRKAPVDAKKLPFADDDDAAIVMTARPKWIEGSGWKGWRWIEGSSQDGEYPGGIVYTFEGLTNDGRFFLRMTGNISHAEVKRLEPNRLLDNEALDKAEKENTQLLKKSLEKTDAASFTPNLNEIDAMIRSIKIQQ